jgi:outer membrane protein TolC
VAQQFAVLQAAMLRNKWHQAEQDILRSEAQLQWMTGITEKIVPELWGNATEILLADSSIWQNNPNLKVLQQEAIVAEQQVTVVKSSSLPQFTIGYLNQGERESPVYNRFNAGVSVPLWRKQYHANVTAVQTGVDIARQNIAAQTLELGAAWQQAAGELEKASLALEDYSKNVLPGARALTEASRRMYEGGLADLPAYLRNRKDAMEAELAYWELLRGYHEAVLKMQFVAGSL